MPTRDLIENLKLAEPRITELVGDSNMVNTAIEKIEQLQAQLEVEMQSNTHAALRAQYQKAMNEFDKKCKQVNKLTHEKTELQAQVKQLEQSEKKAFWWSAEFTHVVHNGKIQSAWEDYLDINHQGE